MSSVQSSWYHDPDVVVRELRRGRPAPVALPRIPGCDEVCEIRRGGQGIVYSAVQRSTKRRVAVKVLLDGAFASAAGRRRFEREIDLVAGLRHTHIVNVYDSGVTDDGRPYLVMEFVDGLPLDQFVQKLLAGHSGELGAKELLRLFVKVCDAVTYAHRRGVIHRDLKPGNVLVDSAGEPRVCDFGLAKETGGEGADESMAVSVSGQFMGSLPWASPEQLDGRAAPVDTRSDVYALGVILFQLVTGRFPYDVTGGIRVAFDSILRAEPARPSAIGPGLDDEIDTIILKCLAKDPGRRYQSAGELERDIRHYLAGEPIEAKRDSAWYTLRKNLRRYRLIAGASLVVLIAVIAALGVSVSSWRSAVRARDEAREESARRAAIGEFLGRMLTSVDPGRDGREVRFLEVINKAAGDLDGTMKDQPVVAAEIHRTLGSTYSALGMFDEAEKQMSTAQESAARSLGARHATTLMAESDLAWILAMRGRLDEGEGKSRAALEGLQATVGLQNAVALHAMTSLGDILSLRGKNDEAEKLLRGALAGQRQLIGDAAPDTLTTINALAVLLKRTGHLEEAERLLRQALELELKRGGPDDPDVLTTLSNLALVLQSAGKLDDSEAMQRETLARRRRVLGEEHQETLTSTSNLATLLMARRKNEEARELLERVAETGTRTQGAESVLTLTAMNNLAKVLQDLGRLEEAEGMFRRTLDARRRVMGPEHSMTLLTASNLAAVLDARGKSDESLKLGREVLEARRRTLGENNMDTIISKNNLGSQLQRLGKPEEAVPLFDEACRAAAASLPADHFYIGLFRGNYGRCLAAMGRTEAAVTELAASCALLEKAFGARDPRTASNIRSLVDVYEKAGRADDAARWREKVAASQPTASQPGASSPSGV